jgi:SAM-dependent methyltransferase
VSVDEDARAAADHDLVFADWNAMTERIVAIMRAHLPPPQGTLLDASCATGMACDAARRMGWAVIGLDASPAMVERARERLPDVDFGVGGLLHLWESVGRTVDVVLSLGDALAEIAADRVDAAVAEMRLCTRLGGTGMIVVRDFTALRSAVWRDDPVCKVTGLFVNRPDGTVAHTLQVDDADGIRSHTRLLHPLSEPDLADMMTDAGFHVRRTGKMLGRVVLSGIAI